MNNTIDRQVTAAFLNGGMLQRHIDLIPTGVHLLDHWGGGHLELVYELMEYADYCYHLADAGVAAVGDCPGVYNYEVAEAFGEWFADQVLAGEPNGHVPDRTACCAELRRLAFNFFERGGQLASRQLNSEQVMALHGALNEALIP